MIASALLFSMLAVDIPASSQRQHFAACLRTFMAAKADEHMAADAFDTAIATACAAEETAYRTAYVAAAVRQGDSRSTAQEDVGVEVEDLRANFKDQFRIGTQPQP